MGPLENETDKIITGRYVQLFFSLGFTMEDSSIMPKITDELISNKKNSNHKNIRVVVLGVTVGKSL